MAEYLAPGVYVEEVSFRSKSIEGVPTSTTGYVMVNKAGTPQGLTKAKFKAGIAGKAQVQVQGKGVNVPMPTLQLTTPVTVQLLIDDGVTTECWQTTFSAAPIANDAVQFKAKGP